MTRVIKTVKSFGTSVIGGSTQTLETQAIKALGDVLSWGLYTSLTTVAGTGTYNVNAGTPSGSWLGSNVNEIIRRVSVKDNQNKDILQAQGTDLHIMSYLLSIVDPNEFLFDRGLAETPTIDTTTVTAQEDNVIMPQSILLKDLPATIEIELGTLADYYLVAGTGTASVDIEVWVRYAPNQESGITVRINAFNVTAFSADTDQAHLLPENLNILKLAYLPSNPNEATVPANMVNTNVGRITFKRGASEEIAHQKRFLLDDWQDQVNTGNRPLGLTVIPTDAFVKSPSTVFEFDLDAGSIDPRIYYVYQ
jgi:hypothetical protein